MKKQLLVFTLSLCCLLLILPAAGQEEGKKPKKKKFLSEKGDDLTWQQAELLFEDGNFQLAFPKYKKLEEKYPNEPVILFRLAVVYLYQPENVEKSLEYLNRLDKKKFAKTDLPLIMGKAYHANGRMDEALASLNEYTAKKGNSAANMVEANMYINYCNNAKVLMSNPVNIKIRNAGAPINTYNSEYVPVISSDESVLMFTYRGEKSTGGRQRLPGEPSPNGEYFEDIFITNKVDNKWEDPLTIGGIINTDAHDACIALSNDGQKLFIFKNLPNDLGSIFMSQLDSNRWTSPKELKGGITSNAWEGSCSLSADERTIFFSSERAGGYGGKDIYKATLQGDTMWVNIKNLGPNVNTDKDDDAPFIHPSGAFLIFSSRGHNSMGGFDIFRTDVENDTSFSKAINIGYPINTPGDDIYYVMSADGKKGYYSSGKSGGMGQQDIYVTEPALVGKKVLLALVKGIITLNDKPVQAEIRVSNAETGNEIAVYKSNMASGKYLFNAPAGKNYKFVFKLPLFDPIEKGLNIMAIDSFIEPTFNISFYTPEYAAMLKAKQDSIDRVLAIEKAMKEGRSNLDMLDENLLAKYGAVKLKGLAYQVQIGAFSMAKNFKFASVAKYGKVSKVKGTDDITRFTIGSNQTMNDAFLFKQKIIAAGIEDAFVTATYNGKRYLLRELVSEKIFENPPPPPPAPEKPVKPVVKPKPKPGTKPAPKPAPKK